MEFDKEMLHKALLLYAREYNKEHKAIDDRICELITEEPGIFNEELKQRSSEIKEFLEHQSKIQNKYS